MSQSTSAILQFITENGVYIGGATAFIFYLFEIFSNLGRKEGRTLFENFSSVVFLLTAAVTTGLAFYAFKTQYAEKAPAVRASEGMHATYAACLNANRNIPQSLQIDIDRGAVRPVELQCLAYAYSKFKVEVGDARRQALAVHTLLGNGLLAAENQRPVPFGPKNEPKTVGKALEVYFGIYADTYLGTGYAVPQATTKGNEGYGSAQLTEYWVPNFCADSTRDRNRCPERSSHVWGWELPVGSLDSTHLSTVLDSLRPTEGAEEYSRYKLENSDDSMDNPWLLRFQKFEAKYYKGTVGRPEAAYVFFLNYRETVGLTVREAMRRSGQHVKELDETKPGQSVFIWFVGASGGQHRRHATWQNLFELLGQIGVDNRLKQPVVAGS